MATARQLEIFLAAARAGSFCKAAESLGISQPGISRQMRALERQVGGKLFTRDRGTSAKLTVLGQTLSSQAQELLKLQQKIVMPQRRSDGIDRPVVLVRNFLLDRMKYQISRVFPPGSRVVPSFKVIAEAKHATDYLKSAPDAFHLSHTGAIPDWPDLHCVTLRTERCGLYLSPKLWNSIGRNPARLSELPWILPTEAAALTSWTRQCLTSVGIPPERMIDGPQFMEIALQQVIDGDGGGIFMDRHVATSLEDGCVIRMPQAVDPLFLVLVSGKSADNRVRQTLVEKFLDFD